MSIRRIFEDFHSAWATFSDTSLLDPQRPYMRRVSYIWKQLKRMSTGGDATTSNVGLTVLQLHDRTGSGSAVQCWAVRGNGAICCSTAVDLLSAKTDIQNVDWTHLVT